MEDKIECQCPFCLRINLVPEEEYEHNVKCYNCEEVFGVIIDVDNCIMLTCAEFKDVDLITGEKYF